MNIELVLFGVFAVMTLLSAGLVITARSPINSAMALVSTFFFLAGIYVLLWAHTVAAVQVLVYAGAIMVLFLFVIMLLNLGDAPHRGKPTATRFLGGASAVGLLAVLAVTLGRLNAQPAQLDARGQAAFGTMAAIGETIFTTWLLPFEAVSLLLLVAMVGAVVVAKSRI
ncbi:NADH-quinone oxidoreductase subunit J [Corallococcus exiguus]|uniref:NADH-quinone oxidoreductase subunit J n=1 Tax=Corallococcus exiguus TaxID=83462 RepID=A0A7X4Y5I6_9BACT|nr:MULTISPECIES: NADH-quinone oxidoreductase subunit J [Corallococcus]NBC39096.1 NADH-quinone oxidoreductase subunit J [Corallococcus exiguus]NNC14626.1 NADH-quinone oxidoreductase subunit J [Corallococcus exiguus]NRD55481.1 NADH-quinone oxidoreductase subunit J [Corallococcus exiguus]NRD62465.1 NADH-quinone oxidoreductase subunit J [Corallococcus exiguus]RKH22544.1 NADH-quinone oxidoreductase subunit J [Corallococcus sp. CA041A]